MLDSLGVLLRADLLKCLVGLSLFCLVLPTAKDLFVGLVWG